MFYNCTSLISINLSTFETKPNNFIDLSNMFYNCSKLESVSFTSIYQSFGVNNMQNMFYNCNSLININLNSFNSSIDNYVNMSYIFYNCYNLNHVKIDFEIFYILDGKEMFYNCYSLKSIKLDSLKTKKNSNDFIDISNMFYNCSNIESITFNSSNPDFGVKDMQNMFYNCLSLKYVDLSSLNSSYDYNINMSRLFYNFTFLEKVDGFINDFYINDTTEMFYNCTSLKSIDLVRFQTNEDIFINSSYMFFNCPKLEYVCFSSLIEKYGIQKIKDIFYNCISLKQVDIRGLKSSNEHYVNMSKLFYDLTNLTTILGDFNPLYLSDTKKMFYNCISLKSLTFNPKRISYGFNMTQMFYNCINLVDIIISNENYTFDPNDMEAVFYNCLSLNNITLNNFNTSIVQNMDSMLYNCNKLEYFNIENSYFDNSLVTNMKGMFQNCESLISLNLSSFYTPNVEIMWDMFKNCKIIYDLNLSNFDTSKVTDMESMFEGCSNLISLNLNHFNTSNVQYMKKMFYNCIRLETINFSQITTESLSTMTQMFYNCENLKYLNIYSLFQNDQSIIEMFKGTSDNFIFCIKEEKIALDIFEMIFNKSNTIRDCSNNCYNDGILRIYASKVKLCCDKFEFDGYCYDKCPSRTKDKNIPKKCENFSCYDSYYNYEQDNCLNNKNIPEGYYVNDTILKTIDKCHESCKTCEKEATNCLKCSEEYPYFYLGNCYKSCKNGNFIDYDGIAKCKCFEEKCLKCSKESLNSSLCISCNEDYYYYQIFNDEKNKDNFVECYKGPEGYYLDKPNSIFRPCFYSCRNCESLGDSSNHLCTSCNSKYSYSYPMENDGKYMNCYPDCVYNFYFDDNNNYICLNTSGCPSFARLLVYNTKQCVNSCSKSKNIYEFNNTCYKNCPQDTKPFNDSTGSYCIISCPFDRPFEMVKKLICVDSCTIMERYYKLCITNYNGDRINEIQDVVMFDIKNDIIDTFDYTFITNNRSVTHQERYTNYEITHTNRMSNNPNLTKINLGKCETRLKEYYSINKENPLYILKIDALIEGKQGPIALYEIYYPFNNISLYQLDLSICEGIDITIGYQLNLTEDNLEVYNKKSPYYNDICYPNENSKGFDITLEDRQQEFKNNNKSICEDDCDFKGYNKNISSIECSCKIKVNIPFVSQLTIDKSKLYKFMDIRKIANFNVLKCINLFFSIKIISVNVGFYCLMLTFIGYIICSFIFCKKDYKHLKGQLHVIVLAKEKVKEFKKETKKPSKRKLIQKKKINRKLKLKIAKKRKSMIQSLPIENNIEIQRENIMNFNMDKNTSGKSILKRNKKGKEIILNKNILKSEPKTDKKHDKIKKKDKRKISKILDYTEEELNDLKYKEATKNDKRSYFQIYISFLKSNHIFLKIFNKNDYNSTSMKILLAIFKFISSYAISALFFSEKTMHQIYLDEGEYNFIYQLPQIIYSSVISMILNNIMSFLALSYKNITDFKQSKNLKKIEKEGEKVRQVILNKFIIFFILNFILIFVFWYYLGCFCAVYKYTQIHLIIDTLVSFGIDNLLPIGTSLIPAIFRKISLSKSKKRKNLYKLSQVLKKIL